MNNLFIKIADINTNGHIDRISLWTFALVVATIFLWRIARKQLGDVSKTAKAEFIRKFSSDFFQEQTRDILMLLDFNALLFRGGYKIEYGNNVESKKFPYFEIDQKVVNQTMISDEKKQWFASKKYYSGFEIDDLLLGPLENISNFEQRKLVDIRQVYDDFDHYINLAYDNYEIRKYIKEQRDEEKDGQNIYTEFEYIYRKCDSYEKNVVGGKWWFCFWEIKWFFIKNN